MTKTGKIFEIQKIFSEKNINTTTIENNDEMILAVKELAGKIPEYRHPSYIKHRLADVVMIHFFAMLANANEWYDIEVFAKAKESWLRKYLDLPYGIPTDDTIRLIISNLDSDHFYKMVTQLLLNFMEKTLELAGINEGEIEPNIIAVDGKVSKGSKREKTDKDDGKALQTLNVFSVGDGLCLGQEFIEEKRNEIPAAQKILEIMDLENTVVTSDAMNCQVDTVKTIVESGGDYVLALKGNHKNFHNAVKEYFDEEKITELKNKVGCYKSTVCKEHGGTAVREYLISDEIDWFAKREEWQKLSVIGMATRTLIKKNGEATSEIRYFIGSIEKDINLLERAVRGHWGVENNLHWFLDVVFKDDKNRSMAKAGAKNMQIMKKIALAILGIVKKSYKLSLAKIRYKLSLNFETEVEKLFSLLSIQSIRNALGK
ncbi:putative transposase YncI [Clostridia bacterium]|nr:putative transposase YncI [Clostridia bacterium]